MTTKRSIEISRAEEDANAHVREVEVDEELHHAPQARGVRLAGEHQELIAASKEDR